MITRTQSWLAKANEYFGMFSVAFLACSFWAAILAAITLVAFQYIPIP